MSSEWAVKKLSSLGEFDRGKSKHRPRDAAHLYGGSYPFIQTGDITNSGGRIVHFRQSYSEAGLAQSRLWPAGTLAITIAANIAETALLTFPACFPDSVVGFTADLKKADVRFIEYLFQAMRKQVKSHAYGSAQENINLEVLRKLEFPIPPLALQTAIAEFLSLLDDRIALLRETNATLEAIAQALFKSWFVDFDPVRANSQGQTPTGMDQATAAMFPDSFEESALGLVPNGWQQGTLADLATLNSQSWSGRHHPHRVRYLDLANVKDNEIANVSEFAFDAAPSRARRVLRSGDTIIGTVRPGNRSFAFIHQPVPDLTASTGFAVLTPTLVDNTAFVYLAATQDASIQHLSRVADGGAYPAVRPEAVSALACVVPSVEICRAFNTAACPLLEKVSANHRHAQTLATLRDTLLPRLISGQIRLGPTEAAIDEANYAN
jgi:type I restriction enzyme, S subunit